MKEKHYLAEFRSKKYIYREEIIAADDEELRDKISRIKSLLKYECGKKLECVSVTTISAK